MKLDDYIKLRKIGVKECAKELGVYPFTISRWISGNRIPRKDTLIKIAKWSNQCVMPTDFFSQSPGIVSP